MNQAGRPLHVTTSLCRVCKDAVPAQVVAVPGDEGAEEVWLRKRCPAHGPQEVRIAADAAWYERTRTYAPAPRPPQRQRRPVTDGCPFDCGPCENHQQQVKLPVVTITSACNLDCPICYVHNKNHKPYLMPLDEFREVLRHLREEQGDIDLINFTGGEPTLHPELPEFVSVAREAGVHRVSICSNGLRLARDEDLVRRLGELGARVALSFDSFEEDADYLLQGAHLLATKQRCLELLARYDVDTTLIPVMTKGVNDHEIGRIIALGLSLPNVRHIEVHTITYTGQGGVSFPRDGRISMDQVLRRIAETTDGLLAPADFVPSPCAHPLCYQIAYLLLDPAGGPPISLARLLGPEVLYDCLSEHLYMEPTPRLEAAMIEAMDRIWASDGPEAERVLPVLRRLLADLFPTDRALGQKEALRISERACKAVYVHSHMDEETFDAERVAQCCDSNCYADGRTIPVCSYNVLYRETEEHFMLKPVVRARPSGGQKVFSPALRVVPS